MTKRPDMLLWLSDCRGRYIPRDFAKCFLDRAKHVSGVSDEDWAVLEAGPEGMSYWETWDGVLDQAVVTDESGNKYRLYQEGDLWLIPEGMEWNEETDSFNWPDERQTTEQKD